MKDHEASEYLDDLFVPEDRVLEAKKRIYEATNAKWAISGLFGTLTVLTSLDVLPLLKDLISEVESGRCGS